MVSLQTTRRPAQVFALTLGSLLLAGCLGDSERPRIWELYPTPGQQLPAITSTTTHTETTTEVYTTPGTTLHYDSGEDRRSGYGRDPYWDQDYYSRYPDRRPAYSNPPYEKAGTGRYYYPDREVRCDNSTGACSRWSGQKGRYLPDANATQEVYGARQRQRIHGDLPRRGTGQP